MRNGPVSIRSCVPFLALVLILVTGCEDSSPSKPDPEPAQFEDLTERGDVIHNLILSYSEKNIEEYSKLLLRADDTYGGSIYPSGYIWYNQPGVIVGEEYISREEDIARTTNIFLAASGTPAKPEHPEILGLHLDILNGTFSAIDSLFGEPCEDCWFTERGYNLFLEMGETDFQALDNVQFYIVPVDEGGTKIYKIAVAKDALVM
jgi:hypothetical protein